MKFKSVPAATASTLVSATGYRRVTIQTKATKEALRDFLYEMQSPERSIVFESANLQFDKNDKTQMHGTFRVAKWYAPK